MKWLDIKIGMLLDSFHIIIYNDQNIIVVTIIIVGEGDRPLLFNTISMKAIKVTYLH